MFQTNVLKEKMKREMARIESEKVSLIFKLDCQESRFDKKNLEIYNDMEDISNIRKKHDAEMSSRELEYCKKIKEANYEIDNYKRKIGKLNEKVLI